MHDGGERVLSTEKSRLRHSHRRDLEKHKRGRKEHQRDIPLEQKEEETRGHQIGESCDYVRYQSQSGTVPPMMSGQSDPHWGSYEQEK